MRLSHARRAITVRFDDPNLVSCAGLVPVMALAERSLVDLQLDQALVTVEGDAHHRPGAAGRRGVAHLLGTQQ